MALHPALGRLLSFLKAELTVVTKLLNWSALGLPPVVGMSVAVPSPSPLNRLAYN